MFFDRKTLLVAACLLTGATSTGASASTVFTFTGDITSNYSALMDGLGATSFSAYLTMDMDAAAASSSASNTSKGNVYTENYAPMSLTFVVGDNSWDMGTANLQLYDAIGDGREKSCPICGYHTVDKRDQIQVGGGAASTGTGPALTGFSFYITPFALDYASNHLVMTDLASDGLSEIFGFNDLSATGGVGTANFGNLGYVNFSNVVLTDWHDVVAGVPEPATWLMMIMGFGLAGVAGRRRQLRHA